MKSYLGPKQKSALVDTFIDTSFNHCFFVWVFSGK